LLRYTHFPKRKGIISKFNVQVFTLYTRVFNIQKYTFYSYSVIIYFICIVYGEVDSVKNTTINIWPNDGVYWQWKKTTCFGFQRPSSGFDNFLAKRVLYNLSKPRGDADVEISSSLSSLSSLSQHHHTV
jgi:hypothetical protein